jgi:hypothetical protein
MGGHPPRDTTFHALANPPDGKTELVIWDAMRHNGFHAGRRTAVTANQRAWSAGGWGR